MNKIRIIPTILFRNFSIVKGKNFASWRIVGNLHQVVKIYALREVDEIIFLDLDAHRSNNINYNLIQSFANECFMPVTVGGGVRNLFDIEKLLNIGADKICINSQAFLNKNFIKEAVKKFGSQCISISIDYKSQLNKEKLIYINSGKTKTSKLLLDWLKEINDLEVGEIICTSIDHEGTMQGFDIETIKKINLKSKSPVIASGGCGNPSDASKLIKSTKVSGLSISSMFHFSQYTPMDVKEHLTKKNFNVRK